ncbi:1,2-phenylacetyl-CoA epoxidase subunit PaaC [Allonocardiopsis opalescens]|uniref:Ring-1,2-phenylacetyl-CoA epoxidase subunit PaaC n=1 Tax=Allonocardiopsis opalescens TaxID=1144618 RepID=A0A2T0Q9J3_9ACTN|nr:1,2-phenylacetyl-CoA epoxidase subunit PaaC [Allonocardiopsis opalescens]PRY00482.1 ring-1,2-phenylacetyl-CoA epoxidase subunit PaaC [Allonocardiopsis opalescens]
MSGDNPYEALAGPAGGGGGDAHWAFGTGFDAPPDEVGAEVPAGADRADLAAYCTMLGDDALVMAQRLGQWCTRAPELEEEVALANIALDLLGQARVLLARAGHVDGTGRDEDALAYLRGPEEFRNVRLVEAPNGDFARSTARLLAFSAWRLAVFTRLTASTDPALAAVAARGAKELAYHRDHAVRWTLRLGDGTALSHQRMADGVDAVWPLLGELFAADPAERRLAAAGAAVDPAEVRAEVLDVLGQVLTAATLGGRPAPPAPSAPGGRDGAHTEHLAPLLAELQSVARAHPGATW